MVKRQAVHALNHAAALAHTGQNKCNHVVGIGAVGTETVQPPMLPGVMARTGIELSWHIRGHTNSHVGCIERAIMEREATKWGNRRGRRNRNQNSITYI